MTNKYIVFNPSAGTHEKFDTLDDAINGAVDAAFDSYLRQTSQTPIVKVTVNEDGSETWNAFDGSVVLSPEQFRLETQRMQEKLKSFVEAQQLPVTNL